MAFIHTVARSYRDSSGVSITSTESPSGNAESNLDIAVAGSSTNVSILFNLTRSQLQSMAISCDVPVTIKTNSSGSPTDTITLIANQNIVWTLSTDLLAKCPITADITAGIFVTVPGAAVANLKIRSLRNE